MSRMLVWFACATTLLAACASQPSGASSSGGPPQPVQPAAQVTTVGDPPEPSQPAQELPDGTAAGAPSNMSASSPAAYWVWVDDDGGWHLRTTTAGTQQQFQGRVLAVSGEVVHVRPSRAELRDRVRQTRRGLIFNLASQGGVDGIDFRTSDKGCVRFALRVDGGGSPKRVIVGAGAVQTSHGHFVVCP